MPLVDELSYLWGILLKSSQCLLRSRHPAASEGGILDKNPDLVQIVLRDRPRDGTPYSLNRPASASTASRNTWCAHDHSTTRTTSHGRIIRIACRRIRVVRSRSRLWFLLAPTGSDDCDQHGDGQ